MASLHSNNIYSKQVVCVNYPTSQPLVKFYNSLFQNKKMNLQVFIYVFHYIISASRIVRLDHILYINKVGEKSNIKPEKIYNVCILICSQKIYEIHNVDQRNAKMTKQCPKNKKKI